MIRYSNKELELIAENELNKCEEDYFIRDGVINIELFIEKHFKLELEYKKLVTDQIAILFVDGFSTCVLPEDDDDFDEEINIIIIKITLKQSQIIESQLKLVKMKVVLIIMLVYVI